MSGSGKRPTLGQPRHEPCFTAHRLQLERELTSFDTSDDEPMVRPMGSRNVVPRVANASFPGQSRHLRRLPVSRSLTPTSSTVPAASGELQLLERGRVVDAVPVMDMSVNDSDLEPPPLEEQVRRPR